jgi:hypothetical protein
MKLIFPIVLIFFYFVWWFWKNYRRPNRILMEIFSDHLAFVSLLTVLLLYTFIFSTWISAFNCVLQTDGSYILWQNSALKCYDDSWYSVHFTSIFFFGVLYIILFIGTLVFLLYLYSTRKADNLKRRKPQIFQFIRFFIQPYNESRYWWELINILKKILLICAGTLSGKQDNDSSSYFFTLFILILFLLIDMSFTPHRKAEVNKLALLWDIIALLILLSDAIIFKSTLVSDSNRDLTSYGMILCVLIGVIFSFALAFRNRYSKFVKEDFELNATFHSLESQSIKFEVEFDNRLEQIIKHSEVKDLSSFKLKVATPTKIFKKKFSNSNIYSEFSVSTLPELIEIEPSAAVISTDKQKTASQTNAQEF